MDPHKRTVTIEVMTPTEQIVGHGRFTTDEDGFSAMLEYARRWAQRTWAIEGCEGIGRHVVARLLTSPGSRPRGTSSR
jgi:transposase